MRFFLIAFWCATWCGAGLAQAPYKYIAPNERNVTYSDLPPPPNSKVLKQTAPAATAGVNPALPYELQFATSNFPAILYTTSPCTSCDEARNFLVNRGVPFSERTVKSNADIDVLKRFSPEGVVPTLVVGRNKVAGYSTGAWGDLLDQAGYPAASKLPPNYQYAPAESAAPAREAGATATALEPSATPAPPALTPSATPAPRALAPSESEAPPPPGFRF